jgi:hypothetical protein
MRLFNSRLGLTVVAAIGMAGIVTGVASSAHDEPERTPTAAVRAEQPPTKWIVTTESEAPKGTNTPPDPGKVLGPPKALADGPWSSNLAKLCADLAPAGSQVASRTDYPDLAGAGVNLEAPNGNVIMVAVQQRTRPSSMTELTAWQNDGILAEWPTGTQYVTIDRPRHSSFQVILARPGGMFVTITVTTKGRWDPIQWSNTFNRESLVAKIRHIFDTATTDTATR